MPPFCLLEEGKITNGLRMGDHRSGKLILSSHQSAVTDLNRLLSISLWEAKVKSTDAAELEVRRTKVAKKKLEIIEQQFRTWKEDSVSVIREYFPQYIAFGESHPEIVDGDVLQWAEQNIWERLEKGCGAERNLGGKAGSPKPAGIVMTQWFAEASEGYLEVDLCSTAWTAPRWLTRNGENTEQFLRRQTRDLSLRFYGAIEEERMKARVAMSIRGGESRAVDNKLRAYSQDPRKDRSSKTPNYTSPWKCTIRAALLNLGCDAKYQQVANWITNQGETIPLPSYCPPVTRNERVDFGYLCRRHKKVRDQFQKDLNKVKRDLRG